MEQKCIELKVETARVDAALAAPTAGAIVGFEKAQATFCRPPWGNNDAEEQPEPEKGAPHLTSPFAQQFTKNSLIPSCSGKQYSGLAWKADCVACFHACTQQSRQSQHELPRIVTGVVFPNVSLISLN
jgi:hypothetical protein